MHLKDNPHPVSVAGHRGVLGSDRMRHWMWRHFLDDMYTTLESLGVLYMENAIKIHIYANFLSSIFSFKYNLLPWKFCKNHKVVLTSIRVNLGPICRVCFVDYSSFPKRLFSSFKRAQIFKFCEWIQFLSHCSWCEVGGIGLTNL